MPTTLKYFVTAAVRELPSNELSIPIAWLYIKSVEYFVESFNGEIWPSRLIGFGIGIIVFGLMSFFLFNEAINLKTFICLILACGILGIQIFWK